MIIGFGHRSSHGKDTAAKYLHTHLSVKNPNLKIKKISFADKLKDVTFDLFAWAGVHRGIYYENNREARSVIIPVLGMTVVDLWVDVGEKMREINSEVWVEYVQHQAQNYDVVLTTDVRHFNEVNICDLKYKVTNPRVPKRDGKSIDDVLENYTGWNSEILNSGDHTRLNGLMEGYANHILEKFYNEAS